MIHFPYQLSIMSLFEQYAMGIPILVPSPEFLWELHDAHDIVTERTWHRVRSGSRPSLSNIPGVSAGEHDPNDDISKDAFLHWIKYGDFYQWKYVVQFSSWDDLRSKVETVQWHDVSHKMLIYARARIAETREKLMQLLWSEVY